jgi:hypothetical protein
MFKMSGACAIQHSATGSNWYIQSWHQLPMTGHWGSIQGPSRSKKKTRLRWVVPSHERRQKKRKIISGDCKNGKSVRTTDSQASQSPWRLKTNYAQYGSNCRTHTGNEQKKRHTGARNASESGSRARRVFHLVLVMVCGDGVWWWWPIVVIFVILNAISREK